MKASDLGTKDVKWQGLLLQLNDTWSWIAERIQIHNVWLKTLLDTTLSSGQDNGISERAAAIFHVYTPSIHTLKTHDCKQTFRRFNFFPLRSSIQLFSLKCFVLDDLSSMLAGKTTRGWESVAV